MADFGQAHWNPSERPSRVDLAKLLQVQSSAKASSFLLEQSETPSIAAQSDNHFAQSLNSNDLISDSDISKSTELVDSSNDLSARQFSKQSKDLSIDSPEIPSTSSHISLSAPIIPEAVSILPPSESIDSSPNPAPSQPISQSLSSIEPVHTYVPESDSTLVIDSTLPSGQNSIADASSPSDSDVRDHILDPPAFSTGSKVVKDDPQAFSDDTQTAPTAFEPVTSFPSSESMEVLSKEVGPNYSQDSVEESIADSSKISVSKLVEPISDEANIAPSTKEISEPIERVISEPVKEVTAERTDGMLVFSEKIPIEPTNVTPNPSESFLEFPKNNPLSEPSLEIMQSLNDVKTKDITEDKSEAIKITTQSSSNLATLESIVSVGDSLASVPSQDFVQQDNDVLVDETHSKISTHTPPIGKFFKQFRLNFLSKISNLSLFSRSEIR